MQTILVHVDNDDRLTMRLENALALARASDGHLRCLHATPLQAYAMVDMFGGVYVLPGVMQAITEAEEQVCERVEQELGNEDVSWEYIHVNATKMRSLAAYATLADIVVVARGELNPDSRIRSTNMIGSLLMNSRAPFLIPADNRSRYDPLKPVVVGWNGSRESANVVRASLPLLTVASSVRIVSGTQKNRDDSHDFPATDVLEYLSRHGVHADLHERDVADELVPDLLLDHVEACDAGTVMIGGYGHRRITEYLFGGVTRSLLRECPVALVIAH